ncbi:MAG TPA: hypothetical protein VGR35_05000 [Tepidisphaeraceae bacterium]|nr:hypothetical protein [Tepidisphaeraceae bacterium]
MLQVLAEWRKQVHCPKSDVHEFLDYWARRTGVAVNTARKIVRQTPKLAQDATVWHAAIDMMTSRECPTSVCRMAPACEDAVRLWYAAALPHIGTKDFLATYSDFLYAWDRILYPGGGDLLAIALIARTMPGCRVLPSKCFGRGAYPHSGSSGCAENCSG